MLINGTRADVGNLDGLIEQLNALPSGFQRRNVNPVNMPYTQGSKAFEYNQEGVAAFTKWHVSKDASDLEMACEAFKKSAEASLKENNPAARAMDLFNYCHISRLLSKSEQGIAAAEEAIEISKQQSNVTGVYYALGALQGALFEVIEAKKRNGQTEEADQLRERLRPLRQASLDVTSGYRGESANPKAHRIEQGEVGFSADEPIGTDNINNCICVMIRDPYTKKTALTHFDSTIKIESLQVLLERMPDRKPPDKPLEARLIGARFKSSPDVARFASDSSRQNIQKVMDFLGDKHVDVLSADILDADQPTSVVVYPETFEIVEEVPEFPNSDRHISGGKSLVSDWGRDLHVAFDLTSSMERAPLLMQKDEIKALRTRFIGRNDNEIYAWHKGVAPHMDAQIPVLVEQTILLREAFQESVDHVTGRLAEKISALLEDGIEVMASDWQKAAEIIVEGPLHVGSNAPIANQPLIDFIESRLFSAEGKHGYVCDFDGLSKIEFPAQPYETIEASIKNPASFQARLAQGSAAMKAESIII